VVPQVVAGTDEVADGETATIETAGLIEEEPTKVETSEEEMGGGENKDLLPAVEPEFYYTFSPSAIASPSNTTMTPPHLAETSFPIDKHFADYEPYVWSSPHSDEPDELFPELNF